MENTAISEANPSQTSHRSRTRIFIYLALICVAGFLALSIIAPFVNAARFSASIQRALENSLGRKITFAEVYYRILPVPGFSLEDVEIEEDPSFGLEPFASRCGLEAQLRVDKLLLGEMRVASLRLTSATDGSGPSLNLVKREDGVWNVVEFVQRVTAPRRMPLNLIPVIQVSNGRLNFKLGSRKTTFYVADADISIYPERSGRTVLDFTGSPARTDRAGNGFGYLRGTLNWSAEGKDLEADVRLLPSNLGEIATLIEGHDVGVHGTVSSRAQIAGPLNALKVTGELRLQNVHRWDLLPSSGDDWRVPYDGVVDLLAHNLELRTVPPQAAATVPASVELKVKDVLTKPSWTLMTSLNQAPVESLLPLARRMGLAVPEGVTLAGTVKGVVGYSNDSGFLGEVALDNAVATLPNIPPIAAAGAELKILPDGLHLEPATLRETGGGTMQVGGDYSWTKQHLAASIQVNNVLIDTFKSTAQAWFGVPAALESLSGGKEGALTGDLQYDNAVPGWSGQFQFSAATVAAQGIALPLKQAQGRVVFSPGVLDLTHFSAQAGQMAFEGSYRYNVTAKRQERVHVEIPEADWSQLAAALEPAWKEPGLLARLPFTRRSIPEWLAVRNLEGDVTIDRLHLNDKTAGPLSTRFVWQGTTLELASLNLGLPDASVKGLAAIDLKPRIPAARFEGALAGFRWGGGTINAQGELQSAGLDSDTLRSMHAIGTFSGTDVSLSLNEDFEKVSGTFELSFNDGWPKLHLSRLQAIQNSEDWSGEALSNSDGQLVFDLGNGDRQLHIVSILAPTSGGSSPVAESGEKVARK